MRMVALFAALGLTLVAAGCASTIHEAAMKGRVSAVQEFLDAGVEVDARDDTGKTPLLLAASWGRTDVIKLLIDKGADINFERFSFTPLVSAASGGQLAAVELLINAGADVNAMEGRALHMATVSQRADIVSALIKAGIKLDGVNENGVTPLWTAAFYNFDDMAKLLIDAGADVNFTTDNDISVLKCARMHRSGRVEALLVAANAKP